MGKTITEKILARASGNSEVKPGDYITVTSRCPIILGHHSFDTFMDRGLALVAKLGVKIFDPSKVVIVDGHGGASSGPNIAEVRWAAQQWAREMNLPPENILNLGRGGIENMISAERPYALPGETFFQGCNGHLSTVGALGLTHSTCQRFIIFPQQHRGATQVEQGSFSHIGCARAQAQNGGER